jgi:tetraacyldisaccharide 4'-kinase
VVVLDDGFQQWGLAKDLEIVLIDAGSPFANAHMLPRGLLRQPLSALKRADLFIISKSNIFPQVQGIRQELQKLNPGAAVFDAAHEVRGFYRLDRPQELIPSGGFRGKSCALFCGIGDPRSLSALAASCGLHPGYTRHFPDHHQYSAQEIGDIVAAAREKGLELIITTEKDAARLEAQEFDGYRQLISVMKIGLGLANNKEFDDRLRRVSTA